MTPLHGSATRSLIAVTKSFADLHRLKRGDSIRIKIGEREIDLELNFLLETKDGDSRFAAMDIGWAQELLGMQGKLTGVLFRIRDPGNPGPVGERIRRLVPADAVVQEPEQRGNQVEKMLAGFQLNLTALSMVSLLVGAFLIYNTVAASVVRRRSEIGILRALGASRAKVRWLFLGEATLYGAIGSVIGCVGGVLLANLLVSAVSKTVTNLYVLVSIDHFYLPLWQIPLVLLLGMSSVLVGAFIPANAGANLPPLQALNMGVLIERSQRPRLLWVLLEWRDSALGVRRWRACPDRPSPGRICICILHIDRVLFPCSARDLPVWHLDRANLSLLASPATCLPEPSPITLPARDHGSGTGVCFGNARQHFNHDLLFPQNRRSLGRTATRGGYICRSNRKPACWI